MSKSIKNTTTNPKHASKKQQWAKYMSQIIAERLRESNPESPLKRGYMNTYNCNDVKKYDGEKMVSSYCKNRWCVTCNRIRTAININHYAPLLSSFGHPFFVTVTAPTVTIEELGERVAKFQNEWRLIYNLSKKKRNVNKGIYISGVRSMECTLRPDGRYHYHMHMIMDGWGNAEWFVAEWLKRFPEADRKAQDVRPADTGALLEVFKYSVKMSKELFKHTDYSRLDAVFQVLRKKRLLSSFGSIKRLPAEEEENFDVDSQLNKELVLRLGNEHSTWKWKKGVYDWVNVETGELLVNEEIPDRIKKMVSSA